MAHEQDIDPEETRDWLDSLHSVLEKEGLERAHYLIERLVAEMRRSGAHLPYKATTAYLNTIRKSEEERSPGEPGLEHRIRSINRWNALAMVQKANLKSGELGGHISSYASSATLYEVAFNHFFHARTEDHGGDLVYFQGHCAPGIYARAFLEGRITEDQLLHFRQECFSDGLSSYPHPWLMRDFWSFPTVSMGLAALMAIYQARFMKHLHQRSVIDATERKVWAFLGDGEMDEPESLGSISLAAREELDNLIFVVNCNLQRLDGPVRGNAKIIQELEGVFRGAGWNVIKVIWGEGWDRLLAKDKNGMLLKRMEEAIDGDYQNYKAKGGAYVREHFFGKYPETSAMVEDMTDDEIWALQRGGHDPAKVYAAYAKAMQHHGQPTVILAKTVKGYGLGKSGESINIAHSLKKPGREALIAFRDRYRIPVADDQLDDPPFYRPEANAAEMQYLHERREALGGYFPSRHPNNEPLPIPDFEIFANQTEGTGEREISTTMSFVRMLTALTRDKELKQRIVPIVPDEARTFGMEGLFRTLGIYAAKGQQYDPVDADQVMWYKEDSAGQILQEGITEAGAMSSWIAAATAYANHGAAMIPFYIYYSMFGFQRIGDLAWAAGDSQARGFLMGGTAGRTTLAGEGLQHQDGHSHVLASTIPNCRAYDPAFNYELAVIIHDGLVRMYRDQENVFFYITVMNENYTHPPMPEGVRDGIIEGIYRYSQGEAHDLSVQLLGSGTILREVIAAAEILKQDWSVESDVFSVTSFNELARNGTDVDRWNLLHPDETPRVPTVTQRLSEGSGPVIAATDYVVAHANQIRGFVPAPYRVLGTDGFGRSDSRENLRAFFEVNRYYVVIAALKSLAEQGKISNDQVSKAIAQYGIDPAKPNPMKV